jgi:hypothetical protein
MSYRRRLPTPPLLLITSESLNSLASPSSLAELRQLQQAAIDMQYEARRPIKLTMRKDSEKRIRRKAPPLVPAEEYASCSSQASGSRTYNFDVIPSVQISRSTSGASTVSSIEESLALVPSPAKVAAREPLTPHPSVLSSTARESPMRRLYGNAKATMSMIDVSPRSVSLPVFVPPRSASKSIASTSAAQPSPTPSAWSGRRISTDASSDSGDSFDQPLTPNSFNSAGSGGVGGNGFHFAPCPPVKAKKIGGGIYGNKSAFLSQLDLGLKRVMDRKEEDGKRQKKGLGRFLGVKA